MEAPPTEPPKEPWAWSDDARKIIIRMSLFFSTTDISTYTGVPERTVRRILSHWKKNGSLHAPPTSKPRGRPSLWLEDDANVSVI